MVSYVVDFILLAILVIGLTALLGVISSGIGEWIAKHRKDKSSFYDPGIDSQKNWRKMTRD